MPRRRHELAPIIVMGGRTTPQIFLSDSSAEAGRLLGLLQGKGFSVVDVPLGMLVNRCRYEIPQLVICDADAREAPAKLVELRRETDQKIPLLLIADPQSVAELRPELRDLAERILPRPLDLDETVQLVQTLCGLPARDAGRPRRPRTSRAPRLVTAARKPYRSDARIEAGSISSAPPAEPSEPHWPIDSSPSLGPLASELIQSGSDSGVSPYSSRPPFGMPAVAAGLSPETTSVLEQGRRRLEAMPRPSRLPPRRSLDNDGPIELRQELLDALSEALDEGDVGISAPPPSSFSTKAGMESSSSETSSGTAAASRPMEIPEEPDASHQAMTNPGPKSARRSMNSTDLASEESSHESTGAEGEEDKTNPGGKPPTHPPSSSLQARDEDFLPSSDLPPLDDLSDLLNSSWEHVERPSSPELLVTTPPPARKRSSSKLLEALAEPARVLEVEQPESRDSSERGSFDDGSEPRRGSLGNSSRREPNEVPTSSSDGLSLLVALARAIRDRKTGAVAAQDSGGVRRVVLTDGDLSTVISSIASESLGHFLRERGDISSAVLASLSGVPQFGRYAGAAFIARGLLGQEQLWPVLRAHSEWILCRALEHSGHAIFEAQIPPRIAEEPAVFGGAAGAEIFVEAMRRTISPDVAMARLGGPEHSLSWGRHRELVAESALSTEEQERVAHFMGRSAREVHDEQPQLLPILLALSLLGAIAPGEGGISKAELPPVSEQSHAIDTDAFIQRLLARRALVDRGDYFAILGVSRSANEYEVARARDELLSDLSEVRLGPEHQDLQPDLELVRALIDEAHLVLSDEVRRFRYRRALDAVPKHS